MKRKASNIVFIVTTIILVLFFVYHTHHRRSLGSQPIVLKISGSIEQNLSYIITVGYTATNDNMWCIKHAFAPFTYSSPSSKTVKYHPSIQNGRHSIDLSLSEFPADKGCQYQPTVVSYSLIKDSHTLISPRPLLLHPEHVGWWFKSRPTLIPFIDDYFQQDIHLICTRPMLTDKPNNSGRCKYELEKGDNYFTKNYFKTGTYFKYNFNPEKALALTLNIETLSAEEFKKQEKSAISK